MVEKEQPTHVEANEGANLRANGYVRRLQRLKEGRMVPGAAFVRRVHRPSTHRFHPSLPPVVDVHVSLGLRRRHGRTRTRLVVRAAPSVRLENVHWSSSRPRSNPTVPGFSDGSTSFLRSPRRTVRETSETPSLTSPQPTVRNVRENPTRTEPNRIPPHVRIFSTGQSWPAP